LNERIFTGQHIIAERSGMCGTLRFNRPEKLNALTSRMRADLLTGFDELESHSEVRVIILTGEGRGFCAGGDIDHLAQLKQTGDRDGFCRILEEGTELVRRFQASPKPLIAQINGAAVGGGLILALACDLRVAAASAVLGMPFAKIGMGPDWGGTWLLTRLVGPARALEMFCTARLFSADEACRIGLVNAICPDEQLAKKVHEFAGEIARFAPDISVRYKQMVYAAAHLDRDTALRSERRCQLEFFDHPKFLERVTNFRAGPASTDGHN
jgi:2-(1,2-epoxy-1,2-dihydrophenyl)acetyl-CoA isomerase